MDECGHTSTSLYRLSCPSSQLYLKVGKDQMYPVDFIRLSNRNCILNSSEAEDDLRINHEGEANATRATRILIVTPSVQFTFYRGVFRGTPNASQYVYVFFKTEDLACHFVFWI
jgi:hypothetical protein